MPERPRIPNFKITDFCGRGGSSEVWIGIDSDGISRAIKIMDLSDPAKARSIEQENSAISTYRNIVNRHPNLLNILYIGRTSRYLYYVLELADNALKSRIGYQPHTLSWALRHHKFSSREIIWTLRKITDAVAFLHANGLAHRDLKPGNILWVNGELQIADPGLVGSTDDDSSCGTPDFRPPWRATSEQSDLYAIGKILYCLYSGCDAAAYPSLKSGTDFRKIRKFNAIAMRCCDDDDAVRFQRISDLQLEIGQLENGPLLQRLIRHRRQVAGILLLAVLAGSLFGNIRSCRREQAESLTPEQAGSLLTRARMTAEHGNLEEAYRLLTRVRHDAPELLAPEVMRSWSSRLEQRYYWRQCYAMDDALSSDTMLLRSDVSLFSAEERADLLGEMLRLRPQAANSLFFLYHYYQVLEQCPDRKADRELVLQLLEYVELKPQNSKLSVLFLIRFANHFLNRGELDAAEKFTNLALRQNYDRPAALTLRAGIMIRRKQYDRAVADLREAIRLAPENVPAYRLLSRIPNETFLHSASSETAGRTPDGQ